MYGVMKPSARAGAAAVTVTTAVIKARLTVRIPTP